MILVDTSAWVEYDRATGSAVHRKLRALIESSEQIASTEPIAMELIGGASDPRRARKLLRGGETIPFNSPTDFAIATTLARDLRAAGFTPRNMTDCLIAAVAIRTATPLLARDRDFEAIAMISDLRLVTD